MLRHTNNHLTSLYRQFIKDVNISRMFGEVSGHPEQIIRTPNSCDRTSAVLMVARTASQLGSVGLSSELGLPGKPVGDGANAGRVGAGEQKAAGPWSPCRPYEEKAAGPHGVHHDHRARRRRPRRPQSRRRRLLPRPRRGSMAPDPATSASSHRQPKPLGPRALALDPFWIEATPAPEPHERSSSRGLAPPSSHASPASSPETSTAGSGRKRDRIEHQHPDPQVPASVAVARAAPSSSEPQAPRCTSPASPACTYPRARGRRRWGPLLLLQRPPPWTCRPPPAEAAAGPAGIFVPRQMRWSAGGVARLRQDLTLSVAAAGTAELLDARCGCGGESGERD